MISPDLRLAIYGASVTAQKGDSGYTTHLVQKLACDGVSVDIFPYSACHFDDAGFFCINDVLSASPNACLLEWNSTYLGSFGHEKLHYVVCTLLRSGILPIFLIFPRTDTNIAGDRESELQIQQIASTFRLPLLDIRQRVSPDLHLRDIVHTNAEGARLYADLIHAFLAGLGPMDEPPALPSGHPYHEYRISRQPLDLLITEAAPLRLRLKRTGAYPELLLNVLVGPYAPMVKVMANQTVLRRLNLFDPWCYYEREMFYTFLGPREYSEDESVITIAIDNNRPDYSVVTKEPFTYDGALKIPVRSLYAADLIVEPLLTESSP